MSIRTILLLLRKDIFIRYRSIFIIAITIGVLIIINTVLGRVTGTGVAGGGSGGYFFLLFGGGLLITSRSFSDMFSRTGAHTWMLLPASIVEKFISRLVQVTLLWMVASWVGYVVFYFIGAATARLLGGEGSLVPLFDSSLFRILLNYIVINALFLLGATYFRRLHFIKTGLFFGAVCVLLTVVSGLIVFTDARIDVFGGALFLDIDAPNSERPDTLFASLPIIFRIARILYWSVLTPFCWFVSYLRLREYEISRAV